MQRAGDMRLAILGLGVPASRREVIGAVENSDIRVVKMVGDPVRGDEGIGIHIFHEQYSLCRCFRYHLM